MMTAAIFSNETYFLHIPCNAQEIYINSFIKIHRKLGLNVGTKEMILMLEYCIYK